jgi:hypothetical protein
MHKQITKISGIANVQKCAVLTVFLEELITRNNNIKGKNIKNIFQAKKLKQ